MPERSTESLRSGIVVRCPICELEFVSTVYELPDKVVKKLKDTWVKDEFSVDLF